MAKPKRTETQRAADLIWLETQYCRGFKNAIQLAEQLAAIRPYKLSFQQIKYDIADLKQHWLKQIDADVGEHRRTELLGLEDQEREAWIGWERSKLDAVTESTKVKRSTGAGEGPSGDQAEKSSRRQGQSGDPAFLKLILDIRTRRAKLLGLDAPTKLEASGPGGGPLKLEQVEKDPSYAVDELGLDVETKRKLLDAIRNKRKGKSE